MYPTEFENEYIHIINGNIKIKPGCSIENLKLSLEIYKQICNAVDNFNYNQCPWNKKREE